ncbi:MAG: DUF938 domain-containing protein [Pseudomonadota bacterium]
MANLSDDEGAKKHAPATLRNRIPLLAALREHLPDSGTVLEVASGSGEHAVFFAGELANIEWQPSDPDPEALASIAAYREEYDGSNLREALMLDASAPDDWPVKKADAIVCINMIHVSPWEATRGLFEGAKKVLAESGGPLILYGPYIEPGVETAPSNVEFHESLKSRNPEWGIRKVDKVDELAEAVGFKWDVRYKMPANNLTLVFSPA